MALATGARRTASSPNRPGHDRSGAKARGGFAHRPRVARAAAVRRARARRGAVGRGGALARHSALRAAGPGARVCDLGRRLGHAVGGAHRHAHDHAAGLCARCGRRHRACRAVQPVAPDRIFALSLRRDPAGDPDRGDRAAAPGLPATAGGGARLRLDRRVLSRAGQHHARPQLGRPQPRRSLPPLRRHAPAGAVGAQAAGGAALHPGRAEDRGRAVADRGGRGRDRRRLGRRRFRARLSHRRGRLPAQHPPHVRGAAAAVACRDLIFFALSLVSHLLLRRWHESALAREV